jgi:hypothetical protein
MGFDLLRWLPPILALLASFPGVIDAQAVLPQARTILDLGEREQIAFINDTMDLGFPANRADQMTMLIINRSALTLPLIEARLEKMLKFSLMPKSFVGTASEMIAYSGDEQALRAISKLMAIDETQFGPLVGRTLYNALNWRNPFTIAYQGLELTDEALSRYTAEWAELALGSNRMRRAWAEAMLDRYGKVPDESDWANDPIASKLKSGSTTELRQIVMRLARETSRKRQQ